ncbi:hypothetical protein [Thauera butanivorans]|uniref:hypothetical protein n=1 Tax=Thauera butanivorans TaxID=86174 RepID=UPI0008389DBF|nr:hypothetical protein [Thauera butanivorans]
MPNTILLRIDALGLEAFQGGESPPARLASFAAGERDAFIDWLRRQPRKARYRMLVDLADECHETETLPRTRGADRRALIGRRLAAWYPQACYARADTLAIDRKANTEQILFSGLARPAGADVWTKALRDAGCSCERLVPASELIAHALPGPARLIVSHSRAGMRLTLVAGHTARLSRLVESTGHPGNAEWQHEIERTLQYANKLQLQAGEAAAEHSGGHLQVAVLAAGSPHAAEAQPHPLDPTGTDSTRPSAAATDSSELLLAWLSRAPHKLGWPGPSPDTAFPLRHARKLAFGAGVLLFASGTGIAAMHWQTAQNAEASHAALQRETARLQHELAEFTAAHAGLDAPPARIIGTIQQVANERGRVITPLDVLRPIADGLDHAPGLALQTLEWSPAPAGAEPALARVKMKLSPDAGTLLQSSISAHAAIETIVAHLAGRGARLIDTHTDAGGDTHVELLLASHPARVAPQ